MDYGSNPHSWTFGSKHLLHFLRDTHSWTISQVILHTWESLSDTSHLDSSSQGFTNEDNKGSHKTLIQNFKAQMIQEN